MPKPSIFAPEPRKGPQRVAPTAEQTAKVVTAKLKSPVGMPDRADITARLVLPRAVLERLHARAHREDYPSLAATGYPSRVCISAASALKAPPRARPTATSRCRFL